MSLCCFPKPRLLAVSRFLMVSSRFWILATEFVPIRFLLGQALAPRLSLVQKCLIGLPNEATIPL